MGDYSYVTPEEVRRVCDVLGLSDWTRIKPNSINAADAEIIRDFVGGEALDIPLEAFQLGLEVELEHGVEFSDANVTNNHPVLTGRIVLAHLKEGLDYYPRLLCMELEMDIDNALAQNDLSKVVALRRKLAESRSNLETGIARQFRQSKI